MSSLKLGTESCWQVRCLLTALPLFLFAMAGCSGATGNSSASLPSPNTAKATTQVSGIILGYAWDTVAQGLRPIQGVPGAAYLGPAIYTSGGYTSAVASARGGYVLLTGPAGDISLALLPGGSPSPLSPGLSPQQSLVLSPGGAAAVVFAAGQQSALVFTNLPGAPQIQQVSIPLPGTITNVCVSDTGLLLVAVANGTGGAEISSVSAQGVVQQLTQLVRYGDMRFIASSNGVLIADAGQNVLWSAADAASGSDLVQIAGAADGLQNPVAVASSWDSHWALVVNQPGTLLRIDLTQMVPALSVACSCMPSTLAPLSGNATFQITPLATGPMWLYEADVATPRTVFVPAVADNSKG